MTVSLRIEISLEVVSNQLARVGECFFCAWNSIFCYLRNP